MNQSFLIALRKLKEQHPALFPVIMAQWCYESNYGESPLAYNANNFSGLKYRDLSPYLPRDVWERVGQHPHTDRKGEHDPYIKCYLPSDFVDVYFAFLRREPYKRVYWSGDYPYTVTPSALLAMKRPATFLAWIAECGFCAWIPRFTGTGSEMYTEYVFRVLKVQKSPKYKEILSRL